MNYISDIIGDAYQDWAEGDNILIATPTGSGKSTFILKCLLPYAAACQKHIVYVCNRKALREQFTVKSNLELQHYFGQSVTVPQNELPLLHILTYQYCEVSRQFPNFIVQPDLSGISQIEQKRLEVDGKLPQPVRMTSSDVLYYVFDEAHYLLNDSLFNSGTNFWLGKLRSNTCIKLFLTATPEPLRFFLAGAHPQVNVDDMVSIAYQKFHERSQRREVLSRIHKESVVDMNKISGKLRSKSEPNYIALKSREINEKCREIDPYQACMEKIAPYVGQDKLKEPLSNVLTPDHSKMSFWYFWKYDELYDRLQTASTSDRWLIFVDCEADGIRLEALLTYRNLQALFLSSGRLQTEASCKKALEYISENEAFSMSILIATSVLDCGVSISDRTVKHIVIAQHQKYTFLQELGRKRMLPDEQGIEVFLKAYSAKEINGVCRMLDGHIRFIASFATLNKTRLYRSTPDKNGSSLREELLLSDSSAQNIISKMAKGNNINLLYPVNRLNRIRKNNFAESDFPLVLKEFEYSKTAFLYTLLAMDDYQKALEDYRTTGDDAFFLKHQLKWVGQEYQMERWVSYDACMTALSSFLDRSSGVWMEKDDQFTFSQKCLALLLQFPIPPQKLKKDQSRYQKHPDMSIGLKKLDACFAELGIPYHIRTMQRGKSHKTQWILEQ